MRTDAKELDTTAKRTRMFFVNFHASKMVARPDFFL